MGYWDGKKVLVVGGNGFIGSHLVPLLLNAGRKVGVTVVGRSAKRAFAGKFRYVRADAAVPAAMRKVCVGQDVVINLAAVVGGVHYNSVHHGSLFRDNMAVSLGTLEAARLAKVKRYVVVSSACVYPRRCTIPTPESDGFREAPEETNAGYGWAKRMAEYAGRAYAEEFDMSVAIARPYNAYGPGDDFDPASSHVIAGLIRRVCEGENPLRVWGDGTATRSFLYVEDFARGLLDVAAKAPTAEPYNIGAEEEISIRDLAALIVRLAATGTEIIFDPTKPAGQPRRRCDATKAKADLGFQARVGLEEGLTRTIAWYRQNMKKSTARARR